MTKQTPGWISYHYRGQNKKRWKLAGKIILYLALAVFAVGASYALFFVLKLNALEKKINPAAFEQTTVLETARSLVSSPATPLHGMEKGRINILLLGIAGEGKPGRNLTDTIMIASLDPETNRVALFSIPRDLYVKVPEENFQGKINSVYQYGLNTHKNIGQAAKLVSRTAEDVTSLEINYYVILNFDGFEKIIDLIGGINIINERDILDTRYPGPNFSYETFKLSKGFHHLDGATALKYVRERHNDPEGDFGRAKRQQQVLQSTKDKVSSAGTFLNIVALNELFDALGETVQTNATPDEINSFIELSKKLDTQNINNFVLDAWNRDSLLKVSHVLYGDVNAFVLVPRFGNYSEIQDVAQNIFDLNSIKRKRESILSEDASVAILNRSGDLSLPGKIRKLLEENLSYKNISSLGAPDRNTEEKTVIYDLTGGIKPFTLDELVAKLPASPVYETPNTIRSLSENKKIDMVISLGKDLAGIYNIKEGTMEDLNNERDNQESLYLESDNH